MIKGVIFDLFGVLGLESGPGLRLNHDLIALIKQLKKRYRIGLLSNTEREFMDRFLSNNDIRPLFDVVLASSQTRFIKPQRELFEIMSQRMDLPFAKLAFIDDSPVNVAAAAGYGLTAILYRDAEQLQAELAEKLAS